MEQGATKRDRKTTWLGALGGVVLVTLIGLFLLRPAGDELARWSYDAPFPWIAEEVPDDLVIVYFDTETKARLGQSTAEPLDRRFYSQLLDRLTADGAKLVLLDILFDSASPESGVDEQLAEAIHRNGRVVL